MKNLFLILFFSSLLLSSCNNEDLTDLSILEENLQIDEVFQSEENSLKFTITEITDSRCASDVTCVWQGEAVVKIEIELPQEGFINLSTFDNVIDTFGIHSFELIDVSPYPISTEQIELEDYVVTLEIREI